MHLSRWRGDLRFRGPDAPAGVPNTAATCCGGRGLDVLHIQARRVRGSTAGSGVDDDLELAWQVKEACIDEIDRRLAGYSLLGEHHGAAITPSADPHGCVGGEPLTAQAQ